MCMWNRGWILLLSWARASLAFAWLFVTAAPAQEKGKEKAERAEPVTLFYRTKADAVAPSSFSAVIDDGVSDRVALKWDLPKKEGKEKEAQEKAKKEFDDLIKDLEKKGINGVEFECNGQWLKKGSQLRVVSVPELTKTGKQRIKDHGR